MRARARRKSRRSRGLFGSQSRPRKLRGCEANSGGNFSRPAVTLEPVDPSTRRRRLEGEIFNGVTHLAGALLALAGLILLVARGVQTRDPWKIGSFAVYGGMLLALYVV